MFRRSFRPSRVLIPPTSLCGQKYVNNHLLFDRIYKPKFTMTPVPHVSTVEKNRPLSPHITMYAPQNTSMMSIFHRISGVSLGLGICGLVLGSYISLHNLMVYPLYQSLFFLANLPSWVLMTGYILVLAGFCYHSLNGIRHLMWDAGYMLSVSQVKVTGMYVLAGALVLLFVFLARSM